MFTKTIIISRFLQTIKRENLIEKGDTIIVGASGGPDSQFLIFLLNEIKKDYNLKIILAHLNHLHREDAYKDEKLVKNTAKKLNLSYFVEHKSMDDYAKKFSLSKEEAGRKLRYKFFYRLKEKNKNAKIAIAHNMDDQAETVLMRIIRGVGLDGLRAMEYKNKSVIRPILDFSKSEILKALAYFDISYNIDSTNLQTDYTRNKLRLDVIPELEKINPNLKKSLVNLSDIAKNDYLILKNVEDKTLHKIIINKEENFLSFDKTSFENLENPLKNRIIRRAISYIKGNINDFSKANIEDFSHITSLCVGKKIEKDDLVFYKNYKSYDLYKKKSCIKKVDSTKLYANDEAIFSSYKIRTKIIDRNEFNSIDKKGAVFFDYSKVSFPIQIRTRKNGDFFNFHKGKVKKLKNFFIDEKVDKNIRDFIPLIFINSKLTWIVGYRRSDDYKIADNTSEILMISVEEI